MPAPTTESGGREPGGPPRLYLDTSAFLVRLLAQADYKRVNSTLGAWIDLPGIIVSSRLLWLEAARVANRERLLGNPIDDVVASNLATIHSLPVTDAIWETAASFEQHIKTLDSLHLATCLLSDSTLLTVDRRMREVAFQIGIAVAE